MRVTVVLAKVIVWSFLPAATGPTLPSTTTRCWRASAATVGAGDFRGLRKLADACGDELRLGVVLYDGEQVVPFGKRLFAAPVSCLWA